MPRRQAALGPTVQPVGAGPCAAGLDRAAAAGRSSVAIPSSPPPLGSDATSVAGMSPCPVDAGGNKPRPAGSATTTPTSSSALSPAAPPFFLGRSMRRGKQLRWRDDTPPLSNDDGSPSYRDILLPQPRATTPASSPAAAQVDAPALTPTLRPIVVLPRRGEGGHRKRPNRRGQRLPSPPP
ncbi:mucin-1-like [Panicum virgatum]|uniref:mucin-1-like n=1 Tax=Panicum virgatum TaxID=38727 RepID=UPI0019D657AF|nr:mucin-1-like [Panicum virgatum]